MPTDYLNSILNPTEVRDDLIKFCQGLNQDVLREALEKTLGGKDLTLKAQILAYMLNQGTSIFDGALIDYIAHYTNWKEDEIRASIAELMLAGVIKDEGEGLFTFVLGDEKLEEVLKEAAGNYLDLAASLQRRLEPVMSWGLES